MEKPFPWRESVLWNGPPGVMKTLGSLGRDLCVFEGMGAGEPWFQLTPLSTLNCIPREGLENVLNELFLLPKPKLVDICSQQPIHRS